MLRIDGAALQQLEKWTWWSRLRATALAPNMDRFVMPVLAPQPLGAEAVRTESARLEVL